MCFILINSQYHSVINMHVNKQLVNIENWTLKYKLIRVCFIYIIII